MEPPFIPGTNFFSFQNPNVKIALTNEFGFSILTDGVGNPNSVAVEPNVYWPGCQYIRNDILSGNNLYYQVGTLVSPSWTQDEPGTGTVTTVTSNDSSLTITNPTTTPNIIINTAHQNDWTMAQNFFDGISIGNGGVFPNPYGNVTIIGQAISYTPYSIYLPIVQPTTGQALIAIDNSGTLEWSTLSGGVTSVSNSDGTLTISPTTGVVVASLALGHANTWTGLQTFGNDISFGGATLNITSLVTGNLIQYNGTNWVNVAASTIGGTPGGSDTQVQFNDAGAFGANSGMVYNYSTNVFTLTNDAIIDGLTVGKGAGAVASNTAFGVSALAANTTGAFNTAVGFDALLTNIIGTTNTAVGWSALKVSTGSSNTAIGYAALFKQTTTSVGSNTAIGYEALLNSVTGGNNVAIGGGSMTLCGSAVNSNTAVGVTSLNSATGNNNTGVGFGSLESSSFTGSNNSAFGYGVGEFLTSGNSNLLLGTTNAAGDQIRTGSYNVSIGNSTMLSDTSNQIGISDGQGNLFLYYNAAGGTPSTNGILGWDNTDAANAYFVIGTGLTYTHSTHTLSAAGSGGTVTAISIASSNGFAGTSSGGATPALTLSTTITGVLKGNGTAISAATSGTDYAPATSGSSILYGNGAGGFSNVSIGSGVSFSGGILSAAGTGGTVTSVATDATLTGGPITTTGTLGIATSAALPGSPTTTTQAASDNSTKVATTAYVTTAVNNAIAGINPAIAVQAATTLASDTSGFTYNNGVSGVGATLTQSSAAIYVADGFTFTTIGQRLLVKNDTQSPSGAFNGIYFCTTVGTSLIPAVFTRALDYDQPSDMNNTGAIPVVNGTVNASTSWVLTSQVVTVGTTPLTFTQFTLNPTSIVTKDANGNVTVNNLTELYTTTATAAGTTTLTVASTGQQFFTGSTTQTVLLPVTSTLPVLGFNYVIVNNSTGIVTVQSSGANNILALSPGTFATFTCILLSGTTAASWSAQYSASESANLKNEQFGITVDGGGSAITTGSKGYVTVPYAGTITGWTILADQSGSTVIDVKRSTYSGFPSTSSIAGSDLPTLSSAQKNQDTTLSGWGSTAVAAGDVIEFVVNSATTVTRVNLSIQISRTS